MSGAVDAGRHQHMGKGPGDAAQQVKQHKGKIAEGILDIVGEDPEEQHVGNQVQPAGVEEHVGEEGQGFGDGAVGNVLGKGSGEIGGHNAKTGGNARQHGVRLEGAGHEEDDDVAHDDGERHELKADDLQGRVVVERNEHYRVFPGTHRMSPEVLALAQRLATKRKSERRLI